jgi:hypothetical protein
MHNSSQKKNRIDTVYLLGTNNIFALRDVKK